MHNNCAGDDVMSLSLQKMVFTMCQVRQQSNRNVPRRSMWNLYSSRFSHQKRFFFKRINFTWCLRKSSKKGDCERHRQIQNAQCVKSDERSVPSRAPRDATNFPFFDSRVGVPRRTSTDQRQAIARGRVPSPLAGGACFFFQAYSILCFGASARAALAHDGHRGDRGGGGEWRQG